MRCSRFQEQAPDTMGDGRAINCTAGLGNLPMKSLSVAELVRDSLAPNTRRAYSSDVERFQAWGGSLPSDPGQVAAYLTEHAASHAPTTLVRWLASLSKAHRASHDTNPDPTKADIVRSVLRGIRRRRGSVAGQAAPLTREILFDVLDALPDDPKAKRDRALLLVGFAGGFRRSELVDLDIGDVELVEEGLVIGLRRSKTDQVGKGRKIGIPFARGRHCPVKALRTWTEILPDTEPPLFRPINRHGSIGRKRLSDHAVSLVVKDRLRKVWIDPSGYSGHSLRAGFVTSAARAGIASWKIRQQTGHASDSMLERYIRETEMFVENAAGALL